jgi:aminopeptidase-like protein
MPEDDYDVCIDSTLHDGHLTYQAAEKRRHGLKCCPDFAML